MTEFPHFVAVVQGDDQDDRARMIERGPALNRNYRRYAASGSLILIGSNLYRLARPAGMTSHWMRWFVMTWLRLRYEPTGSLIPGVSAHFAPVSFPLSFQSVILFSLSSYISCYVRERILEYTGFSGIRSRITSTFNIKLCVECPKTEWSTCAYLSVLSLTFIKDPMVLASITSHRSF